MFSFREVSVTDDSARELLGEYFENRAESFPPSQGSYRTTFPNPEDFLPPSGAFLVAEGEDLAGEPADVGCGGIRRIESGATGDRFEVKHLWVQPHVRRRGLGRALLRELELRARSLGAREIALDTNESLRAAGELYRSSGYASIEPYNDNPNATDWYLKKL